MADGFGTDTNTVTLLGRNGDAQVIGPDSKPYVAAKLVKIITTPPEKR